MVLLWPRQPLALTNDIQPLNLVQEIILELIDFDSHLLIIHLMLVKHLVILLDVFLLLGDSSLVPLPILLQLNTGLRKLLPYLVNILCLDREVRQGPIRTRFKFGLRLLNLILNEFLLVEDAIPLILHELLV